MFSTLQAPYGAGEPWLGAPQLEAGCLVRFDDLSHRQEWSLALCPSPIRPSLSLVSTHSSCCADVLETELECPLQDAAVAWAGFMDVLGCPDIKTLSIGLAELGPTERVSQYGRGQLSCRRCRRVSQSSHQSPVGSPLLVFSLGFLP